MQRVSREAFRISLPILILQGGADRLVRPAGSRMLHDAVSSVDKKIKLYEGLYHEIYNESEYHVVLQDVAQWIEARLSSSQL